jgi:MFS-type transporter involved in bile tolerance (Atg22 family)
MLTWVLVAAVVWVLFSVPLALVVGAAIEHGERVPRLRQPTQPSPARMTDSVQRLAS